MKIALYIEDGLEQIVLTPQSPTEKSILQKVRDGRALAVRSGSFYECRGGFVRQGDGDDSTILVLTETPPPGELDA